MKVRCIDNDDGRLNLTKGKIYDVIKITEYYYTIIDDIDRATGYSKSIFEEVREMEKEKVLEVEFQEVFDKVAWRIAYQNEEILDRGFKDYDLKVMAEDAPEYYDDILWLRGYNKRYDNRVNLSTKEEAEIIKQKVDAINEKYGIPKRWRAKEGDEYWYIHMSSELNCFPDREGDHAPLGSNPFRHENRYNHGNYFRTREEALSKLHEIEKIFAE